MKTFDEVVNETVKGGYGWLLHEPEMREIFESLPPELRWRGVYRGWQDGYVWMEVCRIVHEYIREGEQLT